jgi:hypothetical protein
MMIRMPAVIPERPQRRIAGEAAVLGKGPRIGVERGRAGRGCKMSADRERMRSRR